MIILHATLSEILGVTLVPVPKRGEGGREEGVEKEGGVEEEEEEEEEKEMRVLTRGFGAGRVLCLKAERPVVTPCPSPAPSLRPVAAAATAAAAGGGGGVGPLAPPKWENDEISV